MGGLQKPNTSQHATLGREERLNERFTACNSMFFLAETTNGSLFLSIWPNGSQKTKTNSVTILAIQAHCRLPRRETVQLAGPQLSFEPARQTVYLLAYAIKISFVLYCQVLYTGFAE
jgi:hypothetical protein